MPGHTNIMCTLMKQWSFALITFYKYKANIYKASDASTPMLHIHTHICILYYIYNIWLFTLKIQRKASRHYTNINSTHFKDTHVQSGVNKNSLLLPCHITRTLYIFNNCCKGQGQDLVTSAALFNILLCRKIKQPFHCVVCYIFSQLSEYTSITNTK